MTDSPAKSPNIGGLGSVLKSLTKPFKSSSASGASNISTPKINPTVLGYANGIDLDELLYKMGSNVSSNGTRIVASEMIRSSLEGSAVSSIPEIWYQAKDMISPHNVMECRRAGYRLLYACIKYDEHAVGPRLVYFRDIISQCSLDTFDLQLQALRALSNDCRDLTDIAQSGYPFASVLCHWLRLLAQEVQEIRIGRKRDAALPYSTMRENFHEMLKFIANAIKFNITAFDETSLQTVLGEVVAICRKTSSKDDIRYCCNIVDMIMVVGFLPMEKLGDILEVLCGIAVTVEEQADQSWNTVFNLAKSHAGLNAVNHLCSILNGSHNKEVNSNTMRGAARFLMRLFTLSVKTEDQQHDRELKIIPVRFILKAFVDSIQVSSLRHGLEVCDCIYQMLCDPTIRNAIPYELWENNETSPFEAIYALSRYETLQRRSRRHAAEFGYDGPGDDIAGQVVKRLGDLTSQIAKILEDRREFQGPYEYLVDTMMDLSEFADDRCAMMVIKCFEEDHYCNPMSKNWDENLKTLIEHYWNDHTLQIETRLEIVKLARDVFKIAKDINEREVVTMLADNLFEIISQEPNSTALEELMSLFVEIAVSCDAELFNVICQKLRNTFNQYDEEAVAGVENFEEFAAARSKRTRIVMRSFAQLFVLTFRYSPQKARRTYFLLLQCCQKTVYCDELAFLEAARLLCRIRVTNENYVYLTSPNNMDGLAASVGRSYKSNSAQGNEAWWYPEQLAYLGKDSLEVPSTTLKRGNNTVQEMNEINIQPWFKLLVKVVEGGAPWEVYSFVMAHLAPQLSNMQLFSDCPEDIVALRITMCEQISTAKLPSVKLPSNVNRLEVLVALIRSMSSLIGYNAVVFTKRDTDYIVQAFVLGLSSWETTAVACINGLVVCCYEFPLSIKKFMFQIFNKLQTAITTTKSSPHVLEFLLSLSRLPSLTDNFTLDEYKRVFGMAFKYIQHANDLSKNPRGASDDSDTSPLMSQYLLALAYNVIANWFLTLKLPKRKEMATFITRNLILANGHQNDIAEQSLATLDLITRFTHSDLDLVMQPAKQPSENGVELKSWIYGTSIVSMETHLETGYTRLVMRRPTGTTMFNIRPDEKSVPQHLREKVMLMHEHDDDDTNLKSEPSLQLFSPSYMLLQTILPEHPDASLKPIPLANDAAVNRAIATFDRAPVVDFHKVGVMYIAPGQSTEQEILSNTVGSRAYRRFLSQLGTLIRLKGNKQVYTAGLDTENDIDGEYAYAWNDKITQMIYHTTTLMPNNPHDTARAGKKRHIGNNYVSIYYDESGLPFDFDVIKSMFNFINIVVSPHTVQFQTSSGMSDHHSQQNQRRQYYRVRAYRRDGTPALFAACHLKTVSQEALPLFVRNLALIASKFATVWHSEGQYISNWRYRLQQITQLQDRTLAQRQEEIAQRKEQVTAAAEKRGSAASSINAGGSSSVNTEISSSLASSGGVEENMGEDEFDEDLPLLKNLAFSSFT